MFGGCSTGMLVTTEEINLLPGILPSVLVQVMCPWTDRSK